MSTDDVRERPKIGASKTDGVLNDGSLPTLKEVKAAFPSVRDPSLRRLSESTFEYSPLAYSDQPTDAPKRGTDRTPTGKSMIGDTSVEFKDGQISKLTTSNELTITRQGDKYIPSDGSVVDSLTYDEKRNEVKVRWGTTADGREETTFIRSSGVESVYSPPTRLMGTDDVRSVELSTADNGKREIRIRQNDGTLQIGEVTSPFGKNLEGKLKRTLPAPSKMTEKDLEDAAGEVAHMIKKNQDNLGNEFDRNYLADVYRAFQRNRSTLELDEEVNEALRVKGERGRFELDIFTIRDNSNDVISLRDRQNLRSVASIEVPKPK